MLDLKIKELKNKLDKKSAGVDNFDEVLNSFEKMWDHFDKNVKKSSKNPKIIYAIGQPGAGKTSLREYLLKRHNMILINGDDYRKFHPKHEKFMENTETYEIKTRYFKNLLIQLLIAKCLDEKVDFLLENTFLNKKAVEETIKQAKENGFSIKINVLDVSPVDSWISVNYRMLEMKERKEVIRNVAIDNFVDSYKTIRNIILQSKGQYTEFSGISNEDIKVITRDEILKEDHKENLIYNYKGFEKLEPKTVNTIRTLQQKYRVLKVLEEQEEKERKEIKIKPEEKIPTTSEKFKKELKSFKDMLLEQKVKERLSLSL